MKAVQWVVTAWLVSLLPIPVAGLLVHEGSWVSMLGFAFIVALYTLPFVLVCGLLVGGLYRLIDTIWKPSSHWWFPVLGAVIGAAVAGLPTGAVQAAVVGGGASAFAFASWLLFKPNLRLPGRVVVGAGATFVMILCLIPMY